MKSRDNIVVRMAPSPTGNLHIGTARTALFNYLFAKKMGGKYILRLEDTDKERSTKEFEENILAGFEWLGLEHDELYKQSDRTEIYSSYIKKMIQDGTAYISREEPKEPGQRSEVIRFKNPNKKITFDDAIRGRIEFDTTELADFVIARSEDEPLYHLAVVIDDHEMAVTHVIRGEDHISNTPRQILILEAIGATRPVYAHIPLIFDEQRAKLSKRKHGEKVWVDSFKELGYMSDAFLNFLALLGWHPEGDKEIFTLDELVQEFDLSRVQKSGAVFDEKKLRWVNKEHMKREDMRNMIEETIAQKIRDKFQVQVVHPKLIDTVFERVEVLGDVDTIMGEGELDYFFAEPTIEKALVSWKNMSTAETKESLEKVLEILRAEVSGEYINKKVMSLAEEMGKGNVLWPLRYSLSGRERSPDPFTLLEILGKYKAIERVSRAIELLK